MLLLGTSLFVLGGGFFASGARGVKRRASDADADAAAALRCAHRLALLRQRNDKELALNFSVGSRAQSAALECRQRARLAQNKSRAAQGALDGDGEQSHGEQS